MGHQSASTVVSAISARSAVVHQSASTVVSALDARSAVGHKYASTVVYAIHARTVAGVHSASTVVYALHARSAVVHQCASTVVSAEDARSARSSEHIINQITPSQSVLVPSPFTRPPPPPFLHKSLSHHEAGSKITVAEVQSTRRWPLQQTNTTQGRARLPPLEATMEAFRRQVSGTGAKKKKPEPVTRDAYGFVVRNPNP